jgi:spore coat polysaccharide biosynthesis protein SpsF
MRIGVLINARLASKRLPKKHLRDIGGKTAIDRLLDRIKHIQDSEISIIITTGLEHENKPFEAIAKQQKVDIFYGNPQNIPQRHIDCSKEHNLDAIVSLDADDVLVSKTALSAIVTMLRDGKQLCRTEGLPFGINILWAYTTEYLVKSVKQKTKDGSGDTNWGWIFKDQPSLKYFNIQDAYKIRATLDYPEDLRFFRAAYDEISDVGTLDDVALCKAIIEKRIHRINKRWHL